MTASRRLALIAGVVLLVVLVLGFFAVFPWLPAHP